MIFEYPEDADEQLKNFVDRYLHERGEAYNRFCHIQRFDRPEDAELVYVTIKSTFGSRYGPTVLPKFSLSGKYYLIYVSGGYTIQEIPKSYELYESRSFMGGERKALFLTDFFKHLITSIISRVRLLMGTRVRACLEVKYFYARLCGRLSYYSLGGKFMRYEIVQDKDKEDMSDVIKDLKKLFWEIFKICEIDGAPAAEFKIFMDNFKLCPHKELFDNVVFATKTQRMYFMKELAEFFKNRSSEINEDEEIIAAFGGEDWESKLRAHPDLNLLLLVETEHQSKKIKLPRERNMMDCIDTISKLYAEFSHNKATNENLKLEDDGQLVEVIQYIFPMHTAALAKKALKLGHRFAPASFEPPWGSLLALVSKEQSDSESDDDDDDVDVSDSEMETEEEHLAFLESTPAYIFMRTIQEQIAANQTLLS